MSRPATGKLWVDDERPAPDNTWDVALTPEQVAAASELNRYAVVSLDYCLADGATGVDVVTGWAKQGEWPDEVRLHSDSISGRELLAAIIGDYFPLGGGPVVIGVQ